MSYLADFLLARIAEDEADAELMVNGYLDPPRWRAECAVKRRIVEQYREQLDEYWANYTPEARAGDTLRSLGGEAFDGALGALQDVCKLLAHSHAGHAGWREEWRVDA